MKASASAIWVKTGHLDELGAVLSDFLVLSWLFGFEGFDEEEEVRLGENIAGEVLVGDLASVVHDVLEVYVYGKQLFFLLHKRLRTWG